MKTNTNLIGLMNSEVVNRATWRKGTRFLTALHQVWGSFVTELMGREEPKIWRVYDRAGVATWRVYDPTTNQSAHFVSEQEVRVWLDQRYYV